MHHRVPKLSRPLLRHSILSNKKDAARLAEGLSIAKGETNECVRLGVRGRKRRRGSRRNGVRRWVCRGSAASLRAAPTPPPADVAAFAICRRRCAFWRSSCNFSAAALLTVGREALNVVLNCFGVLATRWGSGNLMAEEWNCLTTVRLQSSGLSSAVLRTWIATALARERPAMSWYMAEIASVSASSRYSLYALWVPVRDS